MYDILMMTYDILMMMYGIWRLMMYDDDEDDEKFNLHKLNGNL